MLELKLKPLTPGYLERSVRIKAGETKDLGRSHKCAIAVAHPEISRRHCEFVNNGSECTVVDLGSVNGVLVNNKRVATKALVDGDVISICSVQFGVELRDQASMTDSAVFMYDGAEESGLKKRMSYEPTRVMGDYVAPTGVDSLRKAHGNLALLSRIGNLIFDVRPMEEKFQLVIRMLVEFFQADRGAILILNPVTRVIEPKATFKISGGDAGNVRVSRTIVNEAVEKGLSVLSANVTDDSRFAGRESGPVTNVTAVMCVPLEGREGIIGAIYLDSLERTDVFSEESLNILNMIGYQVGAAIHQAWLEQDLRRSTRELEEYSHRLEAKVNERTASLTEMVKKLKVGDKLKSQFLANMSHELRTPLNAIVGFAALIRDRVYGEINPRQDDAMDKIRHNAQNLLDLINSILHISRIDAGRMPLYLEQFAPNPVLEELIRSNESLVKPEVAVEFALDTGLPAVYNDMGKYRQVIRNLFANAVKFTAQGKIVVATWRDDGAKMFVTAVRDTGIGMPEVELQHIFDEFYQVDGS